uniref:NAD+-dependent secondary alcohol dehydrogenase Adh1 n=1 Tax=Candidatus Kentrum sp. FW TaxID=2126338 RepID=A0A450TIB1_9GAMM|nr:MAG: NAD+-dependent secondary alcohol dehydrogenase Adh1 [Candidatus Kentron sp. FW]
MGKRDARVGEISNSGTGRSADIVVKIRGSEVCRTDLLIIERAWKPIFDQQGNCLPITMGREEATWIGDPSPELDGLKREGLLFAAAFPNTDGSHSDQPENRYIHWEDISLLADARGRYTELSGTKIKDVLKLPKALMSKDIVPCSDTSFTAYRVAKEAGRRLGHNDHCVIIEAGGLGHIAIQCARAICAAHIIVVETSDAALRVAKEIGADETIKVDGNELEKILEVTGGKGAEAVIDFVGGKDSITRYLTVTRDNGNYYIFGDEEEIRVHKKNAWLAALGLNHQIRPPHGRVVDFSPPGGSTIWRLCGRTFFYEVAFIDSGLNATFRNAFRPIHRLTTLHRADPDEAGYL